MCISIVVCCCFHLALYRMQNCGKLELQNNITTEKETNTLDIYIHINILRVHRNSIHLLNYLQFDSSIFCYLNLVLFLSSIY